MSEDMIKDVTYDDSIAIGGWPIEVHTDISRPSFYIKEFDDKGFQIPLGCLKARDIENLWCCGRIICSDQYALASVRIMASCFSTGHAAGVAAALAGEDGQCDINAVRTELLKQGALI